MENQYKIEETESSDVTEDIIIIPRPDDFPVYDYTHIEPTTIITFSVSPPSKIG